MRTSSVTIAPSADERDARPVAPVDHRMRQREQQIADARVAVGQVGRHDLLDQRGDLRPDAVERGDRRKQRIEEGRAHRYPPPCGEAPRSGGVGVYDDVAVLTVLRSTSPSRSRHPPRKGEGRAPGVSCTTRLGGRRSEVTAMPQSSRPSVCEAGAPRVDRAVIALRRSRATNRARHWQSCRARLTRPSSTLYAPLASGTRMTGTNTSSEGLDARRRKLLFRSWHRGMREMDLILGAFADAAIETLDRRRTRPI